jgi:hypothetical protein
MWGPLVLAGDHGASRGEELPGQGAASDGPIPALVTEARPLTEWLVPAGSKAGDFVAKAVARAPAQPAPPVDLSLKPFYRTHRRRYSNYFDVITTADFDAKVVALAADRERVRKIAAATITVVHPGVAAEEQEAGYASEPADRPAGSANGRPNRAGSGWFSYNLTVEGDTGMALVVTYLNEMGLLPASGNFEILVEGTTIATFEPNRTAVGFWDATYAVPAALIGGKKKVTVRFQSATAGRIAPVFAVRMIRASEVK